MKILALTNLYPPHYLGGYEILCEQVCSRLAARGHEISVLTSNHGCGGASPTEVGHASAKVVYRSLELFVPFGQAPDFRPRARHLVSERNRAAASRVLDEIRPDLVFAWSQLRLTLGAARAAIAAGYPVAWTFNDENIHSYHPGSPMLRPRGLMRWVAGKLAWPDITLRGIAFDHCTTISRQVKNNLVARGVAVERADVIYQGIPVERFPAKDSPGEIGSPLRVLYAGQLHAYKGVHTLLESAARYVAAHGRDAITVTVVGDGEVEYRERLRALAAQAGCPVEFTGRLPHDRLPELYRSHHVFVFPSVWQEPFGLTHLEAMASGTPVISTADGGHGEFLRHEKNALVFAKENAAELCAALERIAADGDLARRLALEARREVAADFSLDSYVDRLEAFLERIPRRRT